MGECNSCREDSPQTRLRTIRNKLYGPLRAQHMAALLEVSDATYYKMERIPFALKPKQCENLSCVGINPEFILFGTGCPFTVPVEKVHENIIDKFPQDKFPILYKNNKDKKAIFEVEG
jgi:hypothetical protein